MDTLAKTKAVHAALLMALDQITKEHGLDTLSIGKLSYDSNGFSASLTGVFAGGDTKELAKLRRSAFMYGLSENVCNAIITYNKQQYKVVGMRNTKIELEQNGKIYTAPINSVVNAIKLHNKELCK